MHRRNTRGRWNCISPWAVSSSPSQPLCKCDLPCLWKGDSCFQTNDLLTLRASSIRIGKNSIGSLSKIISEVRIIDLDKLTGGISFGSSTSFVILVSPFLIGQLRSTLETCSQRLASVLTSLISPYLTCNTTYAPSPTSSSNDPTASIVRLLPLWRSQLVWHLSAWGSYFSGGFGVKLTWSKTRISSSWSALQNLRGLSPGTAAPSPRGFWGPVTENPKLVDKPLEETRVLKSRTRKLGKNFMMII
jgi:hypothetical protein